MARIKWDDLSDRTFEMGVDRGVLYDSDGKRGVPWNGLTSVVQNPDGGSSDPYYLDGFKFLNRSTPEEYKGTIEAFTYPDEFARYNGDLTSGSGLYYGQQTKEEFNLSYRTGIFSYDGELSGYKIHLLYNVLSESSTETYGTLNETPSPSTFSWSFTTRGVRLYGVKPTAELILNSIEADPEKLAILESILYGDLGKAPRMPSQLEVVDLFDDWPYFQLNTVTSTGLNDLIYEGLHDLRGDISRGIYSIPSETSLRETNIPGLYTK